MNKPKLTPEAINKIIHEWMGECGHDKINVVIESKNQSKLGRKYCGICGSFDIDIPDYYNSLDLLRPAEMKLLESSKWFDYINDVYENRLGESIGNSGLNRALFALLTVPASIRATALAQIIGGLND